VMETPKWETTINKTSLEQGEEIILRFEAQIPQDWYMYSSDFDPEVGPMVTEFIFIESDKFELVGEIEPVGQKKKYDDLWEGEYTYFTETAVFQQVVRIKGTSPVFQGSISYQICSDVSGQCIPFESDFSFNNSGSVNSVGENENTVSINSRNDLPFSSEGETLKKTNDKEVNSNEIPLVELVPFENSFKKEVDDNQKGWTGLLTFFLISFGAGLAALLTPCVFPMIPMTVTYFTKSGTDRKKGRMNAFIYGIFIVGIYTVIGIIFSLIFGAGFANFLSTHWLPNLLFFAVFLAFALSFFGLFEIRLPNKFVNKIDQQADRGGFMGIFFMAFTLVLVGFSCTGPIAGTILLQAANGDTLMPLIGMLGFSIAFAIPFTLFAIFPGWLSSLPKSGGWLNTVKVVLGFLELALALKFLSIVDQVYHWNILDREIYLALWIVIFSLLGFYLLGKIVFPHEKKIDSISIPRLMSSVLVFSFVLYLIPGILGAPLKAMSGYLPPMSSQDFNMVNNSGISSESTGISDSCGKPNHGEFLKLPHGIQGFFDYEEALACAKKQDKPLFIDFTGHGCVNCREMEANVWSDPEVLKRLKEDYLVVALYVDEKTELPESEWYVSGYDNKVKKTIGKQNLDFMIQKLNANAQPYYTLIGEKGELLAAPKSYDLNIGEFVSFLDQGIEQYRNSKVNNEQKEI
ncbi:MAG TPA: cytochrome c biogenesis protein CcdA, partial [Gillisia sp.]|nr:cytochrome c biogenesis protein CcdA [Gillisia sp.]